MKRRTQEDVIEELEARVERLEKCLRQFADPMSWGFKRYANGAPYFAWHSCLPWEFAQDALTGEGPLVMQGRKWPTEGQFTLELIEPIEPPFRLEAY